MSQTISVAIREMMWQTISVAISEMMSETISETMSEMMSQNHLSAPAGVRYHALYPRDSKPDNQ
jgi:hypothetical protein